MEQSCQRKTESSSLGERERVENLNYKYQLKILNFAISFKKKKNWNILVYCIYKKIKIYLWK